jgi:two-component system, NarL family, nitrate/nitrite response regulator NarL
MNILLGYANSLSRDFAQRYLGTNQSELSITTAGTLGDCLQLANDFTSLDVVGLDLEMPDMDGISGFRKFRQATGCRIPVALIGSTASGREARDLLLAGAAGYFPYSLSADALVGAIKLVAAGEVFVPADMMTSNREAMQHRMLTRREQQVLTGLLGGKSNREMAEQLCLSEVTIKHHLKGLRSKLGAKNRTHAVCRAIELGIG